MPTLVPALFILLLSYKMVDTMKASECMYYCTAVDHRVQALKCQTCAPNMPVTHELCWRACGHSKNSISLSDHCGKCFDSNPDLMQRLCELVCKAKNVVLLTNTRACEVCHAYLTPV